MSKRRWYRVSLARKICVLFGTAVLLVIAVTLWSPWLQMDALNTQTTLATAQRVATVAYLSVDLHYPNWDEVQQRLYRRWPGLMRDLGLDAPPPRLVRNDRSVTRRGFRYDALTHLTDNPQQRYFWRLQDDRRSLRFALAIRSRNTSVHPSALQGILDLKLPIRADRGIWNSVVTVLAGASGAVLAILVFYMVTQRLVLSPVNALRRVAEQVALGNTGFRSTISSGDEFQKLSDTFNEMLAHLCAAQEQQEKINQALDIKLGELAETNVALYESNRIKSEFLANVSHELRTPLVSIIGFAELLHDAWDSPEPDKKRLKRYSENILTSGRSLLEIINDLLDLAKIEAGKLQLHLSDISLNELCAELVDFVRPLADKRKQTLAFVEGDPEIRLHSDSGRIKQVLYNLLSNAIKFTPEEGKISMEIRNGLPGARVVVSDTGPGIPEDQHQHVFEKFRQLDSSETREFQGTGLGLAITKELVHMLGGAIELQSEVGQGATFVVTLPPRPPGDDGGAAADHDDAVEDTPD